MYYQKRNGKFCFVYYHSDTRMNVRLPSTETPPFLTEQEAAEFCKEWDQKHRISKFVAEEKLSWMTLAPEFLRLLHIFETTRREEAEYSWETYSFSLQYYVFPFFIEKQQMLDVTLWYRAFEDFRVYLQSVEAIKAMSKVRKTLSYSTMNNIIKALNSFLITLQRRLIILLPVRCRMFPKNMLGFKSEESVLSSEQSDEIYRGLLLRSPAAAALFWICLHTGLRINEAMGLSLPDFFPEIAKDEILAKALERQPTLKTYGFILLESQPRLSNIRNEKGEVPRKPLKGKKRISGQNARTIPLFEAETFNHLVKLWNRQRELFQSLTYGEDPKNYLLFHDIKVQGYASLLKSVQKESNYSNLFTPHDTRHTYSTWLAEKTAGDFNLCRLILGHSSMETTLQYVHMGARIQRKIQAKLQLSRPMIAIDAPSKIVQLFPERQLPDGSFFLRKRKTS